MEDIMLIRSSFLRRIISQIINKMLKKQLPGTEVQLGEVQANWSEKEQMLRSAFCCLASLWRHVGIFEGSAHDYNCVGRAAPGYSGCDP